MSSPIQSGEPFGEETTQEIIDRFHRDGFVHIPGVLEAGEMQALRDRTDALLDDPLLAEEEDLGLHDRRYVQMHGEEESTVYPAEHDRAGRDLQEDASSGTDPEPCRGDRRTQLPVLWTERAAKSVWRGDRKVARGWRGPLSRPGERAPPQSPDSTAGALDYRANGAERYRADRTRSHTVRPR